MLNDETYVEAARAIAQRAIKLTPEDPKSRINFIFRSLLARSPSAKEMGLLETGYERRLTRFKREPAAAKKLVAIGDLPLDSKHDVTEIAAYTLVTSTVLNLDEAVTKE